MKIKYQSQFDLLKELVLVGIVFVAICFGLSSFQHDLELKRVHKLFEVEREAKIEVMKFALENERLNKEYISVLSESREALNDELDALSNKIEEYQYLDKFQKDLARHWDKR